MNLLSKNLNYCKKRWYLIIIAIILAELLSSCNRNTIPQVIVKDSVYIKHDTLTVLRLDTIPIPGDTAYLEIKSPCDSLGNLKEINQISKSGKASIQVKTEGNNLLIQGNCDSLEKVITIKDTYIKDLEHRTSSTDTIKREKFIPKFYKYCLYWSIFTIVIGVLYLIIKIKGIKI